MKKRTKIVLLIVGSPLLILVILLVVVPDMLYTGLVTGVEYSPDKFCHRSFRYYVFLDCQVTPKETEEFRCDFDKYLLDNKYITPVESGEIRWRLVKGLSPGVRGWHGSAKSLCQSVGCFSDRDKELVKWLKKNPEMAAILIPRLIKLIKEEKYWNVGLYRGAFYSESMDEFKETLEMRDGVISNLDRK